MTVKIKASNGSIYKKNIYLIELEGRESNWTIEIEKDKGKNYGKAQESKILYREPKRKMVLGLAMKVFPRMSVLIHPC